MRFLSPLSIFVTIGMFAVNVAGFVDTSTGSALGCGREWPLCNGHLLPQTWSLQTVIEFTHRSIVGFVSVFLLLLVVAGWMRYWKWIELRLLLLVSIGFVFLEAFLGALGVLFVDPPAILATHFGVALIAFDAVLLSAVSLRQIRTAQRRGYTILRPVDAPKKLKSLVFVALVYVYLAMYVGAYVLSSGLGGDFRGWPIPSESGKALALDYLHRGIAFGLVALLVWIVITAYRTRDVRKDLFRGSVLALVLALCQAISGGILVLTHESQAALLVHVSVVSLLFGSLGYLAMQVLPEPRRAIRGYQQQVGYVHDSIPANIQ